MSGEIKTYTQEQVDALVKEAVDKAVADALAKQAETIKLLQNPFRVL